MRGREGEKGENIREEKTLVGAEMPYTFRYIRCVVVYSPLNLAISSRTIGLD